MDLTDKQWEVLAPLIPQPPRREDGRGRPWRDPRDVLNGILWILRTGAPWKDLPERYPPYQTCHRRFQRWIEEGGLGNVLDALALDLQERVQIYLSAIKGRRGAVRIVAMSIGGDSQRRNPSVPIEVAARQWRDLYSLIKEIKGSSHAGAIFLSFHRDRMVSSANRLLELGLDIADRRNPRVVPVPIARHPKTEAETRRWDAEISFRIEEHMLSFSVAGVGAHVVYSAVGDEPLVDVSAGYVRDTSALPREDIVALISRSNLEYLALACSLWLLEPTGAMKASAADLDAACFNRMLYAFELNPLMRAHEQARDDKLPEAARSASTNAAAGWSLANLSLRGKPGEVLRRALGEDAPLTVQYERFLQELPSASLIAWEDREPTEPLRSTGNREKNLARRVAANIEEIGNESTTRPGKVIHDAFGMADQEMDGKVVEALGQNDQLLEEFNILELAQLEVWAETAKLTEQQQRVYELDKRPDYDTADIARELGIAESSVRVQRRNYTAKIRRAAGL